MMMPEKRYTAILGFMKEDGTVKSVELRQQLKASYETIRRDLEYLEEQGWIKRTHGGAILTERQLPPNGYVDFHRREDQQLEQKMEVAEYAAELLKEGQSVALDSGTTASKLADVLIRKFQYLTVITNSLRIANQLVEKTTFTVILTGGIIKADEYSMTSDMATLIFSKISSIDAFFLTSCGVSPERGVTYQRQDEIPVQNKMLDIAEKTYLLIDSSKLGINSLIKMCDLDRIHQIVTDSNVTKKQKDSFADTGMSIIHPAIEGEK